MNQNKCKNCKYFFETHRRYEFSAAFEFKGFGICSNEHLVENGDSTMKDDCLNATCDEGRGELEVGQNFGCSYFETVETKNEPHIIG